jgi:Arc/MetJ-type ribon-helix-helix transcriptional regulator
MAVIPVKLNEREVRNLDTLVASGIFKSRNEAIRVLVSEGVRDRLQALFSEQTEGISEVVGFMVKRAMREKGAIRIISRITPSELIAEERDRS